MVVLKVIFPKPLKYNHEISTVHAESSSYEDYRLKSENFHNMYQFLVELQESIFWIDCYDA